MGCRCVDGQQFLFVSEALNPKRGVLAFQSGKGEMTVSVGHRHAGVVGQINYSLLYRFTAVMVDNSAGNRKGLLSMHRSATQHDDNHYCENSSHVEGNIRFTL